MAALHVSAPQTDHWRSDAGELEVRHPAPHVMIFEYRGTFGADVVPFVEAVVARVIDAGLRPDIFVDLEHMQGYDSAYRVAITRWGETIRNRVGVFHLLTRSKLVAMGVSVSNFVLGGFMTATTRRSEFDAAIQVAIRRATVPPPPGA